MDKKIQQKIEESFPAASSAYAIEIVPAKIKGMTARYQEIFLYSRHEPLKKIENEYKNLVLSSKIVVLLGIGLGYLLNLLVDDQRVERIYLVESDIAFMHQAMKTADFSIKNSKIVHISDISAVNKIAESIDLIEIDHVEILREKTFIYTEQRIKEIDIHKSVRDKISEQLTRARFGIIWYDNLLSRMSDLKSLKIYDMPVETIRKNEKQIILIGAGPSLSKNLVEICEKQSSYLIVCIDTIRSFLIKNRVYPDITLSIDSQNISSYHFNKNSINDQKKEIFLLDTLISPTVIKILKQKRISFFRSQNPMNCLFTENVPIVDTGCSAVNIAIDLLYHAGARKIVLAGVDLSFPRAEPYTGGNYFSIYWSSRINRIMTLESRYSEYMRSRKYISMVNMSGGSGRTTPVMRNYAEGIELFLKEHPDLEITTLSEKGIFIDGVKKQENLEFNMLSKTVMQDVELIIGLDPGKIMFPSMDECMKMEYFSLKQKYNIFCDFVQPAVLSLLYKRKKRGHKITEKDKNCVLAKIVYKWERTIQNSVKK